jgi:hypothetical protein
MRGASLPQANSGETGGEYEGEDTSRFFGAKSMKGL